MVLCRWGEGEEDCGANSLKRSGFFAVLYSSSSFLGAVSLVRTGAFPCRCIWLSNLGSEHIWVQAWSNAWRAAMDLASLWFLLTLYVLLPSDWTDTLGSGPQHLLQSHVATTSATHPLFQSGALPGQISK